MKIESSGTTIRTTRFGAVFSRTRRASSPRLAWCQGGISMIESLLAGAVVGTVIRDNHPLTDAAGSAKKRYAN